jgi:hypothetical protein
MTDAPPTQHPMGASTRRRFQGQLCPTLNRKEAICAVEQVR